MKELIRKFCIAARDNDVNALFTIYTENPNFDVNTPFKEGVTALHYACKNGALKAIKFLIGIGGDVSLKSNSNSPKTPQDYLDAKGITKASIEAQDLSDVFDVQASKYMRNVALEKFAKEHNITPTDPFGHLEFIPEPIRKDVLQKWNLAFDDSSWGIVLKMAELGNIIGKSLRGDYTANNLESVIADIKDDSLYRAKPNI